MQQNSVSSKRRGHRLVITLVLLAVVDSAICTYSIDDGILFSLKFPEAKPETSDEGTSSTATTEKSDAEKSVVPADEALLGSKISDDLETILMTTGHNEKYFCTLPKSDSKAVTDKEPYTGPNALSILEKLFVAQGCAYRLEHYWTYELCHGRFLRQFHEERDGKKIKVTEYYLGKYTKDQFNSEMAELKSSIEQGNVRKPPKKKIETMNLPYYELQMVGGTLCDLTGLPRTARIQYVCYPTGRHEIYSFRESSTCEYEVIVLSNIICNHPDYRPEESNEQSINCEPANDKTARKPLDMIAMEAEALQFRSNKMFEAQMFQGDKGPGSVKIEIKPFNPTGKSDVEKARADAIEEDNEDNNYHDENWKETLRREPFKPLMDPEVVKDFLLGKHCLHGGTGWWKYEFCFGKSVDQYHEEKNGNRNVINLGRFNKEKHLSWIEKNPMKQPKAKDLRKQVSHLYSDGDICDVTGKPRQVEVKLKCKPSESVSAVSLYLLEPKTCEYILGIESPLVCDVLPLADDFHGLMEVTEDLLKEHEPEVKGKSSKRVSDDDKTVNGFTPPKSTVKFTPEDAVQSPYGDKKNMPPEVDQEDSRIIADYTDDGLTASDYDDEDEDYDSPSDILTKQKRP